MHQPFRRGCHLKIFLFLVLVDRPEHFEHYGEHLCKNIMNLLRCANYKILGIIPVMLRVAESDISPKLLATRQV